MSGTTVYYNGVKLRDCETRVFQQKIVRDDSGTDALFSRFRIRVTTLVYDYSDEATADHQCTVEIGGSTLSAGNIVVQQARLHALLSENRKPFYYYVQSGLPGPNKILLIATGADPTGSATIPMDPESPNGSQVNAANFVDPDNGPKPENVSIDQVYGGKALRVTAEFVVARRICDSDFSDQYPPSEPAGTVPATSGILNNRWSVSESKDQNWVTTRTISGTLRVASKNVLPHLQRYLVTPPLLEGYQRVQMQFTSDPSDLNLKYQIQDRRRHEAPPAPAVEWSGSYTESAGRHGLHQIGELRLRLTGPPGVDKQQLLGAAGHVIAHRFAGVQKDVTDPNTTFDGILEGSSVIDVIGEPVVEVMVRVRWAEDPSGDQLRLRMQHIGTPLEITGSSGNAQTNYDPNRWPSPLPYDASSLAGVFSCYLQHPCSQYHGIPHYPVGSSSASGASRPGSKPAPDYDSDNRYYQSEEAIDDDSIRVDATEQFGGFPYTFMEISTEYEHDLGRYQMPLATADAADDTCRIVRLHSGLARRILNIELARVGKEPTLPTPSDTVEDPNGITETLLDTRLKVYAPEFSRDAASMEYRVAMQCVYALARPLTTEERYRMARHPMDSSGNTSRYIDGDDFFSDSKIEYRA